MSSHFEKPEHKTNLDHIYSRYVNNPEIERKRPSIEEFRGDSDYKENKRKLEKRKAKIQEKEGRRVLELGLEKAREYEEIEKRSKIFENFLVLEGKNIFGEDTEAVPASEFDDLFNNTDLVLEAKTKDKVIRFAIDAGVSDDVEVIKEKAQDTNVKRIRENKARVRYFKSIIKPDLKGKLENLPRVGFVIPIEFWATIIEAMKGSKENFPPVARQIFAESKFQLESQFLFGLSRNRVEIKNIRKEIRKRPRKLHQEAASELYKKARKIVNGDWEEVSKLLKFFKENEKIFRFKSIMIPRHFEFLQNTKDTLEWLYHKEHETKLAAFEVLGGETKEKAALFAKSAAGISMRHWNTDVFEGLF